MKQNFANFKEKRSSKNPPMSPELRGRSSRALQLHPHLHSDHMNEKDTNLLSKTPVSRKFRTVKTTKDQKNHTKKKT